MSSRAISRVWVGVVATLAVVACLVSTVHADYVTVADWQFNDGALLVDSSGNGHTLAVSSGGTVGNTDGKAVFSGAGWLQTAGALDLTRYSSLLVSYGVDVTTPASSYPMIFEQNSPFFNNPGAIFTHWGPGNGTGPMAGMSWYKGGAAINYNVATYTASQTADYVVALDLSKNLSAPTELTKVFMNGTLISTNASASLDDPMSFANGLFNIGARGDGSLNLAGTISYFKIEGQPVPEPGTIMLLTSGLIGMVVYAWRKRR
jgi:hypothetical protein